jgi:hypothetical protein
MNEALGAPKNEAHPIEPQWTAAEPVIKEPASIYKQPHA